MDILLNVLNKKIIKEKITISGSKSESNRLLILKKIFPDLFIENLSNSDDSVHMEHALSTNDKIIDIGHAGTAMRFLTSYFAISEGIEVILTGSKRMQERPIKLLVEALKSLGANISYQKKDGYPPLKIIGTNIDKGKVSINGNVSSQYISSLLLIAPSLIKGLEIDLIGKVTSVPYINMTLSLLSQIGVKNSFENNCIKVYPKKNIDSNTIIVESDWSSASYFYSFIASSQIGSQIELSSYKVDSLQGDSCLIDIYSHFGVETTFLNNSITLKKVKESSKESLNVDLKSAPDIAQTIAVTCFSEGVSCDLFGLHTLKIKETDRLVALKNELSKLGALISITNESLHLQSSSEIKENISIETYNDHRMAMAFAPLSLKVPIKILDAKVVTKSYQNYWKDLQQIGINIEEI